jgi:hypothetical protein
MQGIINKNFTESAKVRTVFVLSDKTRRYLLQETASPFLPRERLVNKSVIFTKCLLLLCNPQKGYSVL